MKKSPLRVLEELVDRAVFCEMMVGDPNSRKLERALQRGEPIPDVCKPGALLERLDPADRESLRDLTSAEVSRHGWIDYNFHP
jgi:hypothetical protein